MERVNKIFTDVFKKFTKEINKTYGRNIKVGYASDFYCLPSSEKVYVSMLSSEENDRLFAKVFEDRLNTNVNITLLSFLHEVGHIITYDCKYETSDTEQREDIRKRLEERAITLAYATTLYYRLPLEYKANQWVIRFVNRNRALIDKWNAEYYYISNNKIRSLFKSVLKKTQEMR